MAQTLIKDTQVAVKSGLTAGTYTNANVTVDIEGFVTGISNGKKYFVATFYPASSTADTAPNTTQEARLPYGTAAASLQWKLTFAILRVEVPNANATTVQLYYASTPGNAAFSGTAALSSSAASPAAAALSASGTTVYEVSTAVFTGTLGTTGLASGSILAPQFSALGGAKVSLFTQWETV